MEARINEGLNKESGEILTDSFIKDCFELLLTLVPVLERTESQSESTAPPFDSTQHMCTLMEWASR